MRIQANGEAGTEFKRRLSFALLNFPDKRLKLVQKPVLFFTFAFIRGFVKKKSEKSS